jgi:hypothetical protein
MRRNVVFLRGKNFVFIGIVVLGALASSMQVLAMPQQVSGTDSMIKNVGRDTSQNLGQDQRPSDKEESEFAKMMAKREAEQANSSRRREAIRAALISRRIDRIADRENRLSHEERVALRRQIREARIDIYRRNNQKKTQTPD